MKAIAVILVLTGGGMAMGQTTAPALKKPAPLFTKPSGPVLALPGKDLGLDAGLSNGLGVLTLQKLAPGPEFSPSKGPVSQWTVKPRVVVPGKGVGMDRDVDKEMVVHPPREGFAEQAGRTPMVSRLFPKLKILPTEEAKLEPLELETPGLGSLVQESLGLGPTQLEGHQAWLELPLVSAPGAQFPDGRAKAEPIPTTWPKFMLEPIPTTWQGFEMVPITEKTK